jgi:solute carrier family 25 iron transporter 28/37
VLLWEQVDFLVETLLIHSGPAHAVYFATYEVCKQHLGGNVGHGHHPVATGILLGI